MSPSLYTVVHTVSWVGVFDRLKDIDQNIHSKIFSLSLYTVVHTVSWGNKRVLAGVVNLALLVQKEIRGLRRMFPGARRT